MFGILVADYVLIKYFDIWQNMLGMGVVLAITGLAHLFLPLRVSGSAASVSSATGADALNGIDDGPQLWQVPNMPERMIAIVLVVVAFLAGCWGERIRLFCTMSLSPATKPCWRM